MYKDNVRDNVRFEASRKAQLATRIASAALFLAGAFAMVNPAAALTFAQTAHQGPALAAFNGKLYIAVTGTNAQNTLYINSSVDGTTWPGAFQSLAPEAANANAGPALATFQGNLYLAWTGSDSHLNIMHSADGTTFGGKINLGSVNGLFQSTGSPSLTATANYLILSWLSNKSNGGTPEPIIYSSYSTDGVNWSSVLQTAFGTENVAPYAPAISAFDTTGGIIGCTGYVIPTSAFNPTRRIVITIIPGVGASCPLSVPTEEPYMTGVGLGRNNTDLYVAWSGTHLAAGIHIWRYSLSGSTFTYDGETVTTQTTFTNPAITGFNNHVFYAWSGTDNPSHVNVAQVN